MSMSLYQVTHEALEIESLLVYHEGELSPELEARLDALLIGGREKLNAAACVLRNLESSANACKIEAMRLADRQVSLQRNAAALKARMLAAVDTAFNGKVKTDLFTIYGQTSAKQTAFEISPDADLKLLDPAFVRTTYELNRQQLHIAKDAGQPLPAGVTATEKPGTRSLRVR